MCGIALILGPDAEKREAELDEMLRWLNHRGERTGRYSRSGVMAGVRRLPITDPAGSDQPLTVETEDGPLTILFNGEIYNHDELRRELSDAGANFRTQGDTEVVARAWADQGPGGLEKLRGQFAFIILRGDEVVAARDFPGIKPLYYTRGRGCLYFASEIKALVFLGEPVHECEIGSLYHFQGRSEPRLEPLFAPREEPAHANVSDADWLARLRSELEEAVRLRANTELPLGVVYSGGIDSSIVLELARRHHPNVTAFTVGVPGSEDFAVSRRFCEERGIKQVLITPRLGASHASEAVRVSELTEYGDIINAAVSLPLFRAVREAGIKVVLTGDGSDELFAGYNMYADARPGDDGLFQYKLNNLHRTELQRVDRCAMAATVEARVPFLDKRVTALALAMPEKLKRAGRVEKWCLREAFKNDLPEYVIHRPKNPLSHSSGLHEIVRGMKYKFRSIYRKSGYERHGPLRADFSYELRRAGRDLEKARAAALRGADYSRAYLWREALKARLRRLMSRMKR